MWIDETKIIVVVGVGLPNIDPNGSTSVIWWIGWAIWLVSITSNILGNGIEIMDTNAGGTITEEEVESTTI